MASDHQVALTRSQQRMPTPSSQISRAARQVVPAFLQKLYEMVNDPNNAELIRWSEAGDSFFVLDHERFAHEVLGRWFKHRNFSSFVRQLNMYGFHKIPHLQQGVLKSDTDTEFWNFAHANFHRGQPDLLCLIQRKKQVPQPGEEGALDIRDPAVSSGAQPSGSAQQSSSSITSGQILDVNSIVNGIAAIKRHQTTISAELNELKRSNQLLWQDSMAARSKYQKQQDTINRILKFLAGVFGQHAASTGPVATSSPGTPGANDNEQTGIKRRMRLMIEDAKRDGPMKGIIEELPMEMDDDYSSSYPVIGTPNSITSIPSPSPSVAMLDGGPASDAPYFNTNTNTNPQSTPTPTKPHMSHSRNPSTANADSPHSPQITQQTPQQQQQQQQQHGKQISRAVTPSRHSSQSFEFDPRLQGVLNQLSPSQIQHLLSSLASQPLNDSSTSGSSPSGTINPSATTTGGGLMTQYHQPSSFDFSINPASQSNVFSTSGIPILSHDGLILFDNYDSGSSNNHQGENHDLDVVDSGQPHQARMERHWEAAEDIDKDVNALNTSINSLIQTFGLDPSLLDENLTQSGGNASTGDDDLQAHDTPDTNVHSSDFDFFDSFFNSMPSSSGGAAGGLHAPDGIGGSGAGAGMDYNDLTASTAFMDDAATPTPSDLAASPVQSLSSGLNLSVNTTKAPAVDHSNAAPGGRLKRKSDVILDFDGMNAAIEDTQGASMPNTASAKMKRRKDK